MKSSITVSFHPVKYNRVWLLGFQKWAIKVMFWKPGDINYFFISCVILWMSLSLLFPKGQNLSLPILLFRDNCKSINFWRKLLWKAKVVSRYSEKVSEGKTENCCMGFFKGHWMGLVVLWMFWAPKRLANFTYTLSKHIPLDMIHLIPSEKSNDL